MFGFLRIFKKDPRKEAKKQYLVTLELAQKAQRNGDIKQYSFLMEKAEQFKKDSEL